MHADLRRHTKRHSPTVTTIFHIRVTPDTTRPGNPVGDPGLVTTKKEISVPASCESW